MKNDRATTTNGTAANLGFERELWKAADALRNNMNRSRAIPGNPPFNASDWRAELLREAKHDGLDHLSHVVRMLSKITRGPKLGSRTAAMHNGLMTGERKKDKAAKVATARALWVPAVNNHGAFGRWAFIEIDDPWDAQNLIRAEEKQMRRGEE